MGCTQSNEPVRVGENIESGENEQSNTFAEPSSVSSSSSLMGRGDVAEGSESEKSKHPTIHDRRKANVNSTQIPKTGTSRESNAGRNDKKTKTAAEQAAEQYQQRLREKAKAEQDAIRRIKIDEFDPIRPLDSFNITHRALLGRCWDRREVELFPIIRLWHYVHHHYVGGGGGGCGHSSDEGSSAMLLRYQTPSSSDSNSHPDSDKGSPTSPRLTTQNTQHFNNFVASSLQNDSSKHEERASKGEEDQPSHTGLQCAAQSSTASDRIRRSSHWFSVSLVATEYPAGCNSSSSNIPTYSNCTSGCYVLPGPSGTTIPYSVGSGTIEEQLRHASTDDIYAAAYAVEKVSLLTLAQREELYSRFIMRMPRLSGGKPFFAFRLGPETSSEETTKFLRKRGLSPAKGVEIVRWNRVELLRPSLGLIGRAVARIQSVESAPSTMHFSGVGSGGSESVSNASSSTSWDGWRNLHTGDINSSFAGKLNDSELNQPLTGPQGSPVTSINSESFFPSSSTRAHNENTSFFGAANPDAGFDVFDSNHSHNGGGTATRSILHKNDYFPLDAVQCHAAGFSLDCLNEKEKESQQSTPIHRQHPLPSSSMLAIAVNCFSTSVDPFQCEANGFLQYPVELDDSKPGVVEQYGEGVITDVMYGGTMIIESNSGDGITKLEEVLTSMEWSKPRLLSHVVNEIRERNRQYPADPNMQFRLLRRIGGRPMRDAVELDEIKVLLGEEDASSNYSTTEVLQKLSVPSSSNTDSNYTNQSGESTTDSATFSRVASAWMCLNTVVAALRTWALHLLANPEYSQPISLYLQKFAGIATALKMATVQVPASAFESTNAASCIYGSPHGTSQNSNTNNNNSMGSPGISEDTSKKNDELAQAVEQIFEPEVELDAYLNENNGTPAHHHHHHHHHVHQHHRLFTPHGTSWVPIRSKANAPSNTFFDILSNLASSSSSSTSASSIEGPFCHSRCSSTNTVTPDGDLDTKQRPHPIHTRKRRTDAQHAKRAAARALLRGSSTSSFYDVGGTPAGGGPVVITRVPSPTTPLRLTIGASKSSTQSAAPRSQSRGHANDTSNWGGSGGRDWDMAMLELKALQTELQEIKEHHRTLREENEHAVFALNVLLKVFLPSTQVRTSLLPTLLQMNVAVRFPDDLHGGTLQLTHRDWFPHLVAVFSSSRCSVRRVRISTPITAKEVPKLGMLAGLIRMGYAGRQLTSIEIDAEQLFSQGTSHNESDGEFRFTLGGTASATGWNHGLPSDTPPYCLDAEQVRDTLWVLLSAMAEESSRYATPFSSPTLPSSHASLRLRNFPRLREGSFHSIGSFFRSSAYKKMLINLNPPDGEPSKPLHKEAKETNGGVWCCSDDAGGTSTHAGLNGSTTNCGAVRASAVVQDAIRRHAPAQCNDSIIEEAVSRSLRTSRDVDSEAVKATGPCNDIYPFFTILAHFCRCDEALHAGEETALSFAPPPYRHVFNKVHHHEGYAKISGSRTPAQRYHQAEDISLPWPLGGRHSGGVVEIVGNTGGDWGQQHLPPLPYFPPPESATSHSWGNSGTQPQPNTGTAMCSNNTEVSATRKKMNDEDANKGSSRCGLHRHFGYSSYDDEENEIKRHEQVGYSESKDVWDSLEEAVRHYNSQLPQQYPRLLLLC